MTKTTLESPVIVALDFDSRDLAIQLVEQLTPDLCKIKVGKELFTRCGPSLVADFVQRGFKVFLDLKFHDIPNTTAKAVAAAADLGVWMVNVHAQGGRAMMEAAAGQLQSMGADTRLIGVTVLTSMDTADLLEVGVQDPPGVQVMRLATLVKSSGLDGVVCSAHEAGELKSAFGAGFLRVTPGIRPATADANDQTRIMTPVSALKAGSTHLVIGRPITASTEPYQALLDILAEIGNH